MDRYVLNARFLRKKFWFEFWRLGALAAAFCLVSACLRQDNQLLTGDLGYSLIYLQGNHQAVGAGETFPKELIIQVVDSKTHSPITNQSIEFVETTTTGAVIDTPTQITSSSGLASSVVHGPSVL